MKLLLTSLFLSLYCVPNAHANYGFEYSPLYGCYNNDGEFLVGNVAVDIDEECCTANGMLYDLNNAALKDQLDACADSFTGDMLQNVAKYCSSDLSECTVDYETISCEDDVMDMCQDYGGKLVQADIEISCEASWGPLTLNILNKVDCTAAECNDEDIWKVYQASMPAMPYGMECAVTTIASVRIDGRTTSFSKASKPADGDDGDVAVDAAENTLQDDVPSSTSQDTLSPSSELPVVTTPPQGTTSGGSKKAGLSVLLVSISAVLGFLI